VCDEQDPGFALEEGRRRVAEVLTDVAPVQGGGCSRPAASELGRAAALELVQSPDDAARSEVQRQRLGGSDLVVEWMRGPQRLLVEGALGVDDDGGDRRPRLRLAPRSVDQRLVTCPVKEVGYPARPFSRSSANACSVFRSSSRPMPRRTSGAFVNWMSR
jgi:hypothetical protein